MVSDYEPTTGAAGRRPGSLRSGLLIALLAFAAGLIVSIWVLARWDRARALLPARPAPVTVVHQPAPVPAPRPIDSPGTVAAVDNRVAQLEARVDRVGERAQSAAGNAARAEGLLVAFAARRALDRGLALGYVEGQLRERFGATQPRAVATIIAASREPITLDDLQIGLEDLAPSLATGDPGEGWWPALRRELASLFVVRKAGTPSPVPDERLKRARRMLEGGRVEPALAEVARMPGRERADKWMAAARRYIEARRALDLIEAAAILTPVQPAPSPVGATSAGEQAQPLP